LSDGATQFVPLALTRVLAELRELEDARAGLTIDELAERGRVTTRTIRRDLEALEAAGVPLIDEQDGQGRRCWRVMDWRSEAA